MTELGNNTKRSEWALKALKVHVKIRKVAKHKNYAGMGQQALVTFAAVVGMRDEDFETQLGDFYCDLHHLADAQKANWAEAERWAGQHLSCIERCTCGLQSQATTMSDLAILLSDLRRFASEANVDWSSVLESHSLHYEAETHSTCPRCEAQGCPEMDYEYDETKEGDFAICYNCGKSFEVTL